MSALTRYIDRKRQNPNKQGGKVYKAINSISIIGLFIAVGLIVLMITKTIDVSANMTGIIIAIGILCFSCVTALPWIRRIERGEFKKLSYVFLGLVIISCVLWIAADIVVITQYKVLKNTFASNTTLPDEERLKVLSNLFSSLNFLKVALFLTIQFSIASFVATTVTKYGKTMLAFQVITYLSYLFVDFWISGLLFSFSIKSDFSAIQGSDVLSEVFYLNKEFLEFLINKAVLTILALAVVYVGISNAVMKRQDQRKLNYALQDMGDGVETPIAGQEEQSAEQKESVEERLEKLKKMYESEIITKEEYEQKRAEILKDL